MPVLRPRAQRPVEPCDVYVTYCRLLMYDRHQQTSRNVRGACAIVARYATSDLTRVWVRSTVGNEALPVADDTKLSEPEHYVRRRLAQALKS